MKLFVPPTLWYEDEEGNFLGKPDYEKDPSDPFVGMGDRKKARYQVSRFPTSLRTSYVVIRDDGSSGTVAAGESGWWEELVLAMATAKPPLQKFRLSEAILIAATSCERCMNALAWRYGVTDDEGRPHGYPEDSDDYRDTNTQCHFCNEELHARAPK